MILSRNEIIQICKETLPVFLTNIQSTKFEIEGIFNSEMLLVVSLAKHFNVKQIIESGRANGQSTKIFVEYFKDSNIKIKSIEFERYSAHVRVANERLRGYRNVDLIFRDAFQILPSLLNKESIVLIDGPKRIAAIKLAIESLRNPSVKAVFIHDLYKDSPHRKAVENMFLNTFFTDDEEFVNKFKLLDLNCWLTQRNNKEFRSWGPYKRGYKKFKSYSSTLLCILNEPNVLNNIVFNSHVLEAQQWKRFWKVKYLLEGWPKRLKYLFYFPKYYIYYEKVINTKSSIDLIDFLLKWGVRVIRTLRAIFKKRVSYYLEDD